jgi:endonuclease-3
MTRSFRSIIDALRDRYGHVDPPPATTPMEMILWEQVAYLADDPKRLRAFRRLHELVGTSAGEIAEAPGELLLEATRMGGIHAEERAERARASARMMLAEYGGNDRAMLALPTAKAKKALARFPMIGEPGAEKILLFTHTLPVLALESNGLRVLLRLGYGAEVKSYAASYRSAQEALRDELPHDCNALIEAHLLLRRHGQELCRRTRPGCGSCPVAACCAFDGEE